MSLFHGPKIYVCALYLFNSLLWNLIFFDFSKKKNEFPHSMVSKKINKSFSLLCMCEKNLCLYLKKNSFSPSVLSLLFSSLLTVVCSVVAMTRTSAAGHPLHQAVSFHFLFLLLFFSLFSILFFTIVFFFVFLFFIAFFVPFCNFSFPLPLVCFISLFSFFFLLSFLQTLLVLALLVWSLLLWISSCFSVFL